MAYRHRHRYVLGVARRKKSDTTRGTAPSAADITELEKMEASEEAKRAEPSSVDAMGQDKRRQVVGHSYGPSRKSQFVFFGVLAALVAIVIGGSALAIGAFDQPPDEYADQAEWTGNQVETQDPANPCGEPGNPQPAPDSSPCSAGYEKRNGIDEADEPASGAPGGRVPDQTGS